MFYINIFIFSFFHHVQWKYAEDSKDLCMTSLHTAFTEELRLMCSPNRCVKSSTILYCLGSVELLIY